MASYHFCWKCRYPNATVSVSLERATKRREYRVQTITEKTIADQQQIADRFFRLKLIPIAISVQEAVIQTNFVEEGLLG